VSDTTRIPFNDHKLLLPGNFTRAVPDGDTVIRDVCGTCGFVAYQNPKIVVGAVAHHLGSVVLCRRAIEPRAGFWTVPAGYLEIGETITEGTVREAKEEAGAAISIESVLAVYTIPEVQQVHIMHIARLDSPQIHAGPESLEVKLFEWDEIPWSDLAFPSVRWTLTHFKAVEGQSTFPVFTNPPPG
jgi:ADP-ribose pyrophosphatase YjhB (NUDIX family)